jgi:hypothetical protein
MPIQLFVNNLPTTHPFVSLFVCRSQVVHAKTKKLQEHATLTCFNNKLKELKRMSEKKQTVESCCKP